MENIQMENEIQYAKLNFKLNQPKNSKPAIQSENDIHYADLKFYSKTQNQSKLQHETELNNTDETGNAEKVEEIAPNEGTEVTQNASNDIGNGTNIWLKGNMRKVSFVAMTCVVVISALICVVEISIQHISHGHEAVTTGSTTSVIEVYDTISLSSNMNTTLTDLSTSSQNLYVNQEEKDKKKWRFGIFSHIVNATFNVVKRLEAYCINMVMLKGNVWCMNSKQIFIYERDFLLKNTLEFKNLKRMKAICDIGKGYLIIVDLNKGLHTISVNGDYVEEIVNGKFKDVCFVNNKLFALTTKKESTLVIYTMENNIWMRLKTIRLNRKYISSIYTLENQIYAFAFQNQQLTVYDVLLNRTKTEVLQNKKVYHKLKLLGVDDAGSLLLSSRQKNGTPKLIVYGKTLLTAGLEHKRDKLKCILEHTANAAVVDMKNHQLWVAVSTREVVIYDFQ